MFIPVVQWWLFIWCATCALFIYLHYTTVHFLRYFAFENLLSGFIVVHCACACARVCLRVGVRACGWCVYRLVDVIVAVVLLLIDDALIVIPNKVYIVANSAFVCVFIGSISRLKQMVLCMPVFNKTSGSPAQLCEKVGRN